jgi:hypothetical protein
MNVAYLFTFFLAVVLILFILLPFMRQGKSTFTADPVKPVVDVADNEDLPLDLGREEAGDTDTISKRAAYEVEIEVAVVKARRHKSTFSKCSQCGRQMQADDRFCPSCGLARQSS